MNEVWSKYFYSPFMERNTSYSLIQYKILFEETGPLNLLLLFLVLSNLFSKIREQKLQFTRIDLGSNIFHPHHNKGD